MDNEQQGFVFGLERAIELVEARIGLYREVQGELDPFERMKRNDHSVMRGIIESLETLRYEIEQARDAMKEKA